MNKWVSVKTSLPPIGRAVNVCCPVGKDGWVCRVARYATNGKFYTEINFHTVQVDGVTHWAELPEPPDEEQ